MIRIFGKVPSTQTPPAISDDANCEIEKLFYVI